MINLDNSIIMNDSQVNYYNYILKIIKLDKLREF